MLECNNQEVAAWKQNRLFAQDFSAPLDTRWDYRQDDSEMEIKEGGLRLKGKRPGLSHGGGEAGMA